MKHKFLAWGVSATFLLSFNAQAENCTMQYDMKGWSAFYKTYKGTGVVKCPSGKTAKVNLSLQGGGFTFGASEIKGGTAKLMGIETLEDIYGGAFALGGHAGFGKSIEGRWVPRGARTVTLSGKGSGYDLGWSMGSFKISRL